MQSLGLNGKIISYSFVPPQELMAEWEADYKAMQNDMIYGDSKSFVKVIEIMHQLEERFREIER